MSEIERGPIDEHAITLLGGWSDATIRLNNPKFTLVAPCRGLDGDLQIIALGEDRNIYLAGYQLNQQWFMSSQRLTVTVAYRWLAPCLSGDGTLQVIALGMDKVAYVAASLPPGGSWDVDVNRPISSQGAAFISLSSCLLNDGTLQVVGLGIENAAYQAAFMSPGGIWATNPTKLVSTAGAHFATLTTCLSSDGTLQVIGLRDGGVVWVAAFKRPGQDWAPNPTTQVSRSGSYVEVIPIMSIDGTLQVIGLEYSNWAAYVAAYLPPGQGWSQDSATQVSRSNSFSSLAACLSIDGTLQVIGRGKDDQAAYVAAYLPPGQGWSQDSARKISGPGDVYKWLAPFSAGNGSLQVIGLGNDSVVYLAAALLQTSTEMSSWMSALSDEICVLDINLPGTHDSAAINRYLPTAIACQYATITEQLMMGIRLLDVRLSVNSIDNSWVFHTCHGDWGGESYYYVNVYQDFTSLLIECKDFLSQHPTEFIVMSLKIDAWNGNASRRTEALAALRMLLNLFPTFTNTGDAPNLGSVKGQIYLLNRIDSTLTLGDPISWTDNTNGQLRPKNAVRRYDLYVQDNYKDLAQFPDVEKLRVFLGAIDQAKAGQMLLNFASGTQFDIWEINIRRSLLGWFGLSSSSHRKTRLGWSLFDFAGQKYPVQTYGFLGCIDLIVNSNFAYNRYPQTFYVLRND